MDGDPALGARGADEIRRYLIDELNRALRRPGMFGGEQSLRLYLDALAFAAGLERAVKSEMLNLKARGAFVPSGVTGAVERLLGSRSDDVMASVYVEVARRIGWLELDSPIPLADYQNMRDGLDRWPPRDRTYSEVLAEHGSPSLLIGGTNPGYPKTLVYAPADRDHPPVFFHLWNGTDPGSPHLWPPDHPEPVLLAGRCAGQDFVDGFVFTPFGNARRRA